MFRDKKNMSFVISFFGRLRFISLFPRSCAHHVTASASLYIGLGVCVFFTWFILCFTEHGLNSWIPTSPLTNKRIRDSWLARLYLLTRSSFNPIGCLEGLLFCLKAAKILARLKIVAVLKSGHGVTVRDRCFTGI